LEARREGETRREKLWDFGISFNNLTKRES
jgi:hypothetical protein